MTDSNSSEEDKYDPVGAKLILTDELRDLPYARHWYHEAKHLCLAKHTWIQLCKHIRPYTLVNNEEHTPNYLRDFCSAHRFPGADTDTLANFQTRTRKYPSSQFKQRCKGISSLRGNRCLRHQGAIYCALHDPNPYRGEEPPPLPKLKN